MTQNNNVDYTWLASDFGLDDSRVITAQ